MTELLNTLKIISFNCFGLRNPTKRGKVYEWLKSNKTDIAFLQETHCTDNVKHIYDRDWEGISFHSTSDSSHKNGVQILFKKNMNCEIISNKQDDQGRYIIVTIQVGNNIYKLANIYAPTKIKDRDDFLVKLRKILIEENSEDIYFILGGDFNLHLNKTDKNTHSNMEEKTIKKLKDIISDLNLIDCWNSFRNEKYKYTWENSKKDIKSRLDYFLISRPINVNLKKCCTKIVISNKVGRRISDHKLIEINLNINEVNRGPGYWKMNNKILEEKEYQELVIKTIKKFDKLEDICNNWEKF